MSRVGKQIITIPEKTEVSFKDGVLTVKGPLGETKKTFKSDIEVKIEGGKINLKPKVETIDTIALWGTYASHIINMIEGVNKAYEKKLSVEGIGYKSEVKGDTLVLNVGFSHQVKVLIPKNLKVTSDKNIITVSGIDKEAVGEFVAKVKDVKKPEPYKGKGIRYVDEVIRRKQGKKTA